MDGDYKFPPAVKDALNRALRQFRHNSDNSPSLGSPEQGFVTAYDKDEIDRLVAGLCGVGVEDKRHVTLTVVMGVAGPSLCLDDADGRGGRRVAGPKPWGGGSIFKTFRVDWGELLRLVNEGQYLREGSRNG